jgi:hypothetical protein
MSLLKTKQDFIRVQQECRENLARLRKVFPQAFDKNGKPLVATLRPLHK